MGEYTEYIWMDLHRWEVRDALGSLEEQRHTASMHEDIAVPPAGRGFGIPTESVRSTVSVLRTP
jgi:hypothetical protein